MVLVLSLYVKLFDLSQLTFDIRLTESAMSHIPYRTEGGTEGRAPVTEHTLLF
jgi:hypothetical protein